MSLVVRGGTVVDPAQGLHAPADVLIRHGRVACVGPELPPAEHVLDVHGLHVVPGLIDTQVHLTEAESPHAHAMLARAGVTTALDLAGPLDAVLGLAARRGAGLSIAAVELLEAPRTIAERDPSAADAREAVEAALRAGAIGVKLHVDSALTPDGMRLVIEAANERRAWVACHCGSSETASTIEGLREAVALAGAQRLHVAHVNSYCRGEVGDPVAEAQEAIALLRGAPHLFAESYMSPCNGNWAECRDGRPVNPRVARWLEDGGFRPTEDGMEAAILAGWARITADLGDESALVDGAEGVAAWRRAGTRIGISFPKNPLTSRVLLAVSRDGGRFDVPALATDGGGVPRNDQATSGMALVALGGWSWEDFVTKTSHTPARVLGLRDRGHLAPGARADLAVLDPRSRRVVHTIARGALVMTAGRVLGSGTEVLTTPHGEEAVRRSGCEARRLDVAASGFYGDPRHGVVP